MTGRIVSPEEARRLYNQTRDPDRPVQETIRDLAFTVERQAERIADLRQSLGAMASAYLGLLMDQKFSDGTSVFEVMLETSPTLRAELARAFGGKP